MMSKNHVLVGASATTAAVAWVGALNYIGLYSYSARAGGAGEVFHHAISDGNWLRALRVACRVISEWLIPYDGSLLSLPGALYLVLIYAVALLASVMPDMDNTRSKMGKRLPGKLWRLCTPATSPHRGLTHAVWFPVALLVVGIIFEPVRFLIFAALSWSLHCRLDMLSPAGRAWFYPWGKFRVTTFSNGTRCVIKKGQPTWYKVATPSERVVAVTIMMFHLALVALAVLCAWYLGHMNATTVLH